MTSKSSIQHLAEVEGEIRDIKEFLNLRGSRNRPKDITCPIDNCGQPMTMVLTKDESVRRSHFRHKSTVISDHSPESIWHFGAKYHIGKILRKGGSLLVKWRCDSCFESYPIPPMLKAKPTWVDIDSKKIGKFLPDITLYNGSEAIGVIEVCNQHSSTDEKIEFYNSIKLPWIEIQVDTSESYERVMQWTGGSGLSGLVKGHFHPDTLPAICPSCTEKQEWREKIKQEKEQQVRKAEEYKENIAQQAMDQLTELSMKRSCSVAGCNYDFSYSFVGNGDDEWPVYYDVGVPYELEKTYQPAYIDILFFDQYEKPIFALMLKRKSGYSDATKEAIRLLREQWRLVQKGQSGVPWMFVEVGANSSLRFSGVPHLYNDSYVCEKCKRSEAQRLRLEEDKRNKEMLASAQSHLDEAVKQEAAIKSEFDLACGQIRLARPADDKTVHQERLKELRPQMEAATDEVELRLHRLEDMERRIYLNKASPFQAKP